MSDQPSLCPLERQKCSPGTTEIAGSVPLWLRIRTVMDSCHRRRSAVVARQRRSRGKEVEISAAPPQSSAFS